jgi:hypothetical protein
MSFESLKREAAALAPTERRQLIGFLLSLNVTDEERASLSRKIDDNDPSHWLSLDEVDAKLKPLGSDE